MGEMADTMSILSLEIGYKTSFNFRKHALCSLCRLPRGCWSCPYDAERDAWLREQGLTVIVISEDMAINADDLTTLLALLPRRNGDA